MHSWQKILISSSLVLLLNACTTANLNCSKENFTFSDQQILLNTATSTNAIFVLHNISSQSIWLNHETGHSMSAGWASSISPNHWSALSVNKPNFNLTCETASFKPIACHEVLEICHLSQPPTSNISAWVAEDKSFDDIRSVVLAQAGTQH